MSDETFPVYISCMSTDPFTGRSLSCCFVELATKAQADQDLSQLNEINIMGHPMKISRESQSPKVDRADLIFTMDSRTR